MKPTTIIDDACDDIRSIIHVPAAQAWRQPGDLYETLGALADLCIKLDGLTGHIRRRLRSMAADTDLYAPPPTVPGEALAAAHKALIGDQFDVARRRLNEAQQLMSSIGRKV